MSPRSGRRIGRAVKFSGFAAVAGGIISFVLEVTANQLSALGRWAPWVVMVGGTTVAVVLLAVQYWWPPAPVSESSPAASLPPPDDLVGRDRTIEAVVEQATAHNLVLVHGPSGIGTSAVAVNAAWRLGRADERRYVDLRGVRPGDTRSARMHVLRTLGLDTWIPGSQAGQAVVNTLKDSRYVLLVDNVTGARQVAWMAHAVPGAYVIVAGDLRIDEVPGAADVPVPALDQADALALLRAQDPAYVPRGLARIRDRVFGLHRHSIDARIAAERTAADTLADRYLRHPRVAIQLGRWLARKPDVTLSRLLRDLDDDGEVSELRTIVREILAGASPGARWLLGLLAAMPEVEYSDQALAALAGTAVERAGAHLAELDARFLVHRGSSGTRIERQAANLAERPPDRAVSRARARLTAFYARPAAAYAELLAGRGYVEAGHWFARNDVTLRALLTAPAPPRRAGRHLWALADALDLWFTWDGRRQERWRAARAALARARELDDVAAQATALVRMAAIARRRGRIDEARRLLGRADALGNGRGAWLPQLRTEWALCHALSGDAHAARNELRRCRETRPRRDLEGRMTDLINLAVLDIRDDRHEPAADLLEEAIRLAARARRPAGEAHARELRGIARYAMGQVKPARQDWNEARTLYGTAGDPAGQARCERYRSAAG